MHGFLYSKLRIPGSVGSVHFKNLLVILSYHISVLLSNQTRACCEEWLLLFDGRARYFCEREIEKGKMRDVRTAILTVILKMRL